MRPKTWLRKLLLGANLAAPAALLATRSEQPAVILAAAAAHSAFACAVMRPQCGWFGPVATHFRPSGNDLWLTIDDGPAGSSSEVLAQALEQRGVRATFFVKGRNLAAQAATGLRLLGAGHTLANHTDTHPAGLFPWLRWSRLRREVEACNEALRVLDPALAPRWFRSPVGLKHARLHPLLQQLGMRLVAWTVRGGDTFAADPAKVAARVARGARPGAIILLHEGRARSNEIILHSVDVLLARGFRFVIPDDAQLA